MKIIVFALLFLGVLSSCSPLRSSPNNEQFQLELTLHEVQTNLDDFRRDIQSFQAELQIIDSRLKNYENSLAAVKQQTIEKQQSKLEQLAQNVQSLEKKCLLLNKCDDLLLFANETTAALAQFKGRIGELEQELFSQNNKFNEMAKGKNTSDHFALYKVKTGDSLEKIARLYHTTVEKIKTANSLHHDLIVVGQELKIPS